MKRILTTGLLALCAGALTFAATIMHEPHQLTSLWKQYKQASQDDLPQKEAEILTRIKQEARKQHYAVDFWDAATAYVNCVQRRDWKQRDTLREQLKAEVEAFGDPMVTFLWMEEWKGAGTGELWAYVQAHPEGFQGRNAAFYEGLGGYLGGALQPFVDSDRAYVLWRLYKNAYYRAESQEVRAALEQEVRGKYPAQAALELFDLSRRSWKESQREEERAAYQALAAQYPGQAVSLFPRAHLLYMELADLDKAKAPESAYKALYQKVLAFEKERKACKGDEAVIARACTSGASLAESFTEEDLEVFMDADGIRVVFQNLTKAKLTLRQGKTAVNSWTVENPQPRFYLRDTVKLALPKLADGEYSVEAVSGDVSDQAAYEQFTLSVATRLDGNGRCVYVADYKTGQPLKQVMLELRKGDKVMALSPLTLDGFTPLPADLDLLLDGADRNTYYHLVAVSGDRRSQPVGVQLSYYGGSGSQAGLHCNIYKDQGAYRPGDTVHFKAVLYTGDPATGLHVFAGKSVEVCLYDSEDNLLESKKLRTNDFGSVWGAFTLPTGLRNGYFHLEVKDLATEYFRVDEFVLPSFDLRWDALDQLYFVGQEIPVSGELLSYSGHNLAGARLHLAVTCYGLKLFEADAESGGRSFRFNVPLKRVGWYQTVLTVTDLTGETLEFKQGFYVSDRVDVEARVENAVEADWALQGQPVQVYRRYGEPKAVIRSKELNVTLLGKDGSGRTVPIPVQYRLCDAAGRLVTEGQAQSGHTVTLPLPAGGLYTLETSVSAVKPDGKTVAESSKTQILCTLPSDKKLPDAVRYLFLGGETTLADGQGIHAVLGSGQEPVWAVVTVYGEGRKILENKQIKLAAHTLAQLDFSYKASWPDAVRLQVFYFLDGQSRRFEQVYRRARDRYSLPLAFTRFTRDALPGTEYTVTLKTAPGVEALAAIWDKSLDAISANEWPLVHLRDVTVDNVYLDVACGCVGARHNDRILYKVNGATRATAVAEEAPVMAESAVMDDAAPAGSAREEVTVRSDFATALAFEPALQPAADGTLSFHFRTADKLTTYYIRVYAHDPALHNALVQEEMVVSLPVQVQLLAPRFLYAGDVWEAAVSLSSVADVPVSGILKLAYGDASQQVPITVPAGQGAVHRFQLALPDTAQVTASFLAEGFSDAVQVTIPVLPAAQQLTEAHSAVLHAGQDREALLAQLRSRFVNVPASQATLRDISILDMVREAIPAHAEPAANDVLSLSEAWYVKLMADALNGASAEGTSLSSAKKMADAPEREAASSEDARSASGLDDLLEKVLACQNLDGGFAWFEGMDSSPVITAVVLERVAKLRDRGFAVPDLQAAVAYLDKQQFATLRPLWRGGVTDAQYLYVRSLFPEVPFTVKPVSVEDGKRMDAFDKWAKDYLAPSTKAGRGMVGQILPKARRVLTLRNLLEREGGSALVKAWGVKLAGSCRLKRSLKKDLASLQQYAVQHRDGGWYYPNAVLPWRGLLESEAYAHAMLCDLLSAEEGTPRSVAKKKADAPSGVSPSSAEIADGIRLWLMLQKETQQWEADPAFVDAITAILDGSEAVLDTRVLVLSASYEAPFSEVKAAGNGFSVERKFYRDGVEIQPGETLKVGEKIVAKYRIWNAENRSFVKLTAGREASLQPEKQLSGMVWGGYRNVKAERTEFFFDSYPEENTELSESFFVTQAGTFQAPAVVIESLYAPHYRANDVGHIWNSYIL